MTLACPLWDLLQIHVRLVSIFASLYKFIWSALLICCSHLILSQRICQIEMKQKFLPNLSQSALLLCLWFRYIQFIASVLLQSYVDKFLYSIIPVHFPSFYIFLDWLLWNDYCLRMSEMEIALLGLPITSVLYWTLDFRVECLFFAWHKMFHNIQEMLPILPKILITYLYKLSRQCVVILDHL